MIAGLRTEIWTRDLLDTMQGCSPLGQFALFRRQSAASRSLGCGCRAVGRKNGAPMLAALSRLTLWKTMSRYFIIVAFVVRLRRVVSYDCITQVKYCVILACQIVHDLCLGTWLAVLYKSRAAGCMTSCIFVRSSWSLLQGAERQMWPSAVPSVAIIACWAQTARLHPPLHSAFFVFCHTSHLTVGFLIWPTFLSFYVSLVAVV
jgi:hypothetical protein